MHDLDMLHNSLGRTGRTFFEQPTLEHGELVEPTFDPCLSAALRQRPPAGLRVVAATGRKVLEYSPKVSANVTSDAFFRVLLFCEDATQRTILREPPQFPCRYCRCPPSHGMLLAPPPRGGRRPPLLWLGAHKLLPPPHLLHALIGRTATIPQAIAARNSTTPLCLPPPPPPHLFTLSLPHRCGGCHARGPPGGGHRARLGRPGAVGAAGLTTLEEVRFLRFLSIAPARSLAALSPPPPPPSCRLGCGGGVRGPQGRR